MRVPLVGWERWSPPDKDHHRIQEFLKEEEQEKVGRKLEETGVLVERRRKERALVRRNKYKLI